MRARSNPAHTRTRAALAALMLGLLAAGCSGPSDRPGPAGPPPTDGGPEAGKPPGAEAGMPPGPSGGDPGLEPDKPAHQLCTADLQDFLAHGVKVEDMEKKIEHGLELGVTSLPLLATPEELAQLREQGLPQELLDKWLQPVAGAAPAEATPPGPESTAP
ncbi:MAG: hypothetical protein ABIO70_08640 [Pseudomonadota bacterium]